MSRLSVSNIRRLGSTFRFMHTLPPTSAGGQAPRKLRSGIRAAMYDKPLNRPHWVHPDNTYDCCFNQHLPFREKCETCQIKAILLAWKAGWKTTTPGGIPSSSIN